MPEYRREEEIRMRSLASKYNIPFETLFVGDIRGDVSNYVGRRRWWSDSQIDHIEKHLKEGGSLEKLRDLQISMWPVNTTADIINELRERDLQGGDGSGSDGAAGSAGRGVTDEEKLARAAQQERDIKNRRHLAYPDQNEGGISVADIKAVGERERAAREGQSTLESALEGLGEQGAAPSLEQDMPAAPSQSGRGETISTPLIPGGGNQVMPAPSLTQGMPAPPMPEGGNQPTITERRRDSLSDPNRMTAMDQRRIVASEQGADRRTYQLLRRAYQGHARAGRGRRGDPDANMRALEIFQGARGMGMNLSQAYQQRPREGQVRANLSGMSQSTDVEQARAIRRQQNFFDQR